MNIDIVSGLVSGIICAVLVWAFSVLINIKAKNEVLFWAKRLQSILYSINNDITWGIEDKREDYYDNLIVKVPYVYQYLYEIARAISVLNFCIFGRRAYIKKQLEVLENDMDYILSEVNLSGKNEKQGRLISIGKLYQTTNSNILVIRAEFIEKLTYIRTVDASIAEVATDDDENVALLIESMLKDLSRQHSFLKNSCLTELP